MTTPAPKKSASGGAGLGPAPEPELRFEEALERVEAIIQRIESGEAGLEASLAEYERGMRLVRQCRDVLARAEQRVEELNRQLAVGTGGSGRAGSAGGPAGSPSGGAPAGGGGQASPGATPGASPGGRIADEGENGAPSVDAAADADDDEAPF